MAVETVPDAPTPPEPDRAAIELARSADAALKRGYALRDEKHTEAAAAAFEEALHHYRQARAADSNRVEPVVGMGRAQFALTRFDQARSTFDRARRMADDNADAHLGSAVAILARLRKEREAIDDGARERLLADAQTRLTRVTELAPRYVDGWWWLIEVATERGDTEAVAKALKQAVEANGNDVELRIAYGQDLQREKQLEEALEQFGRAVELSHGDDQTIVRARASVLASGALLDLGRAPDALRTLEAISRELPADPDADLAQVVAILHYYAAIALRTLRRYDEAIERLAMIALLEERQEARWAIAFFALYLRVHILRRVGRYAEAWRLLPEAREAGAIVRETDPSAADVQFLRNFADVLRLMGEHEEAIRVYNDAIAKSADDPYLRFQLIATHLEQGEQPRATAVAGEAAPYWSSDDEPPPEYARASHLGRAQYEFSRAEPLYLELVKLKPGATNRVALGALYMLMERDDAARPLMREAIRDSRRDGVANDATELAHAHLGVSYARRREYGRAAQEFEAAHNCDRDELEHRIGLAEAHLRLGRLAEARRAYESILSIAPGNVAARIGLAEVLTARAEADEPGLYELAIREYQEAIRLADGVVKLPVDKREGSGALSTRALARLHYQIGYARTRLFDAGVSRKFIAKPSRGHLSNARQSFKAAAEIDPGHPQASAALQRVERELGAQHSRRIVDTYIPVALAGVCLAVLVLINLCFFLGPLRNQLTPGFKNHLTPTNYAMLSFGIIVLLIAVVSLPQLLKLKIAGVSLEKTAVEHAAPVELGIPSDFGSSSRLALQQLESERPKPGEWLKAQSVQTEKARSTATAGADIARGKEQGQAAQGAKEQGQAGPSASSKAQGAQPASPDADTAPDEPPA